MAKIKAAFSNHMFKNMDKIVKYETRKEPVYLFKLPKPYWYSFCDSCDNRRLAIEWIGILKIKEKKVRYGLTSMELMMRRLYKQQMDSLLRQGSLWDKQVGFWATTAKPKGATLTIKKLSDLMDKKAKKKLI